MLFTFNLPLILWVYIRFITGYCSPIAGDGMLVAGNWMLVSQPAILYRGSHSPIQFSTIQFNPHFFATRNNELRSKGP